MTKFRLLVVSGLVAASIATVPLVAIAMQGSEPAASDLGLLAGVI